MVVRDMLLELAVEPPDMLEQAERSATSAKMAVSLNMLVLECRPTSGDGESAQTI